MKGSRLFLACALNDTGTAVSAIRAYYVGADAISPYSSRQNCASSGYTVTHHVVPRTARHAKSPRARGPTTGAPWNWGLSRRATSDVSRRVSGDFVFCTVRATRCVCSPHRSPHQLTAVTPSLPRRFAMARFPSIGTRSGRTDPPDGSPGSPEQNNGGPPRAGLPF